MRASASLNTAYHKRNLLWQVRRTQYGYARGTLIERYETALRHFVRTSRGSLRCHPNYGSTLYRLRTQGINSNSAQVVKAELQSGISRYIPDISINRISLSMDPRKEQLQLTITINWSVNGATTQMHGELGQPKKLQVSI